MKIFLISFAILISTINSSAQNFREEFDNNQLDSSWNFVRNLDKSRWSLTERKGFIRLKGSTVTLDDTEVPPVYIGRKQGQNDFEATCDKKLFKIDCVL